MEVQVKIETHDEIAQNPYPASPELDSIAMAVVGARSPRKMERVVSRSSDEITKQEEKLELLKNEVKLEESQLDFEEASIKVLELETAFKNVCDELDPLEKTLSEIRAVNAPAEQKLFEAENQLYQLKAKAVGTKATIDHMNAFKQDIEVSKLKPSVLENMIQIMSLVESIEKKTEHAAEVKKALQDARDTVGKMESHVLQLKTAVESERDAWTTKWDSNALEISRQTQEKDVEVTNIRGTLSSDISNITVTSATTDESVGILVNENAENEFAIIKAKLEYAEEEIMRQFNEIERLKKARSEDGKGSSDVSVSAVSAQTESGTKTQPSMTNLVKENQALKERLERMEPLCEIGYYTRARSVELGLKEIRKLNGVQGRGMIDEILNKGTEAHKGWNSKADACMFMRSSQDQRRSATEFLDIYGVDINSAWEHRKYSYFQNMITWKAEMTTRFRNYNQAAFNEHYDKLFRAIMPNFEINNDIAIQSNVELREAYEGLKKEYGFARQADFAHYNRQRGNQNSFYHNYSNNSNNNNPRPTGAAGASPALKS